jgi:hypothetical protein
MLGDCRVCLPYPYIILWVLGSVKALGFIFGCVFAWLVLRFESLFGGMLWGVIG